MPYSLETKIKKVVLMAKFESLIMIIRKLKRREATDIPVRQTIRSIYQKFFEIDSVQDLARTGKSSIITEEKIEKVQEILENEPINTVRNIDRQPSISKY